MIETEEKNILKILEKSDKWHEKFGTSLHDRITSSIYKTSSQITEKAVVIEKKESFNWDLWLDRLFTSKFTGIPFMLLLLTLVFWITIAGANIPSAFLAGILMEEGGLRGFFQEFLGIASPAFLSFSIYDLLNMAFTYFGSPWWLKGFLVDGVYLGLAWVVAVMLPPMAIFFPLFTLLEDLGVLPRIAFNLDRIFKFAGGHGKQALTMAMGFGCNAAGVIACRIIDSPREKLIAILTNNFVPCNGRWPTMILVSSIFIAKAFPAGVASLITVASLTIATLAGIGVTFLVSYGLSRTVLKGESSSFTLELPPYRPPQILRVIYTSFIDRTIKVLYRAIACAAPAGGIIWLLGAIPAGNTSLFQFLGNFLQLPGQLIGLDGIILLAFIFAIPANEIVVPTIIMGYMNVSRMTEIGDPSLLFLNNGWTVTTAVCVILFSLLHYPCTTTTLTIWSETRSIKWTVLSNLIPLSIAILVCFAVNNILAIF